MQKISPEASGLISIILRKYRKQCSQGALYFLWEKISQ